MSSFNKMLNRLTTKKKSFLGSFVLFSLLLLNLFHQTQSTTSSLAQAAKKNQSQLLASQPQLQQSPSQPITTTSEFEFTNKIAVNYIWPTFPIGFLVLGTISNILSLIVFTRREMRKFSSFCYFAFLNAINLAVLYVTLIRVIMDYNFKTDIRKLNLFTCKMHVFLTYFLGHLSSLLVCTISIDRVISVMFLHKARTLCTPQVAMLVTCGLTIFNFVLSSHFLVFDSGHYNLIVDESINGTVPVSRYEVVCETRNGTLYNDLVQNLWKIIDMSIYAFIPFIIMLICSVIIIFRVAQTSKKFEKNKKKQQKAMSNGGGGAGGSGSDDKFNSRTRNLALMLIPVNILFLMFLAPVVLTMYLYEKLSEDQLTLAIVELLSYCNFTFNFFIYFLTSSKFREEFFKFFNQLLICSNLSSKMSANKTNKKDFNTNVGHTRAVNLNHPTQSPQITKQINAKTIVEEETIPMINNNTNNHNENIMTSSTKYVETL